MKYQELAASKKEVKQVVPEAVKFKYYLILKKSNGTIYLVFLKSEDFNDKKILSLFEK